MQIQVEGAEPRVTEWRADHHLSVVNAPFIAHAFALKRRRRELCGLIFTCGAEDQCTGYGAKHTSLFGAVIGPPAGARRKLSGRVLLVLPGCAGGGVEEVALEGSAYARPLDVAEHVRQVKVGYHHRLQGAIITEALQGGGPVSKRLTCASQALGVRQPQELAHIHGSGGAFFL